MSAIADLIETMEYGPAPESADIVNDWLDTHSKGFGHFIGGAFTAPGKTFDVMNPATGKTIAKVTQGTADDVDAAVKAGKGPVALALLSERAEVRRNNAWNREMTAAAAALPAS